MSGSSKPFPGRKYPFSNSGFNRQHNKQQVNCEALYSSTDVGVQATPFTVAKDDQPPTSVSGEGSDDQSLNSSSTKEKTPMCLVNELVRYNKIPHKYVLVDEQGPAHKKEFFVKLEIGQESFQASGSSIKRAQHAAAEKALRDTQLTRPTPRAITKQIQPEPQKEKKKGAVTPTVELNSLAMKLGIQAEYSNIDTQPKMPYFSPLMFPFTDPYRRIPSPYHSMRFMSPFQGRPPRPMCQVLLKIGPHEFKGDGTTRQQARHNAATKALRVIKSSAFRLNTAASEDSPDSLPVDKEGESSNEMAESLAALPGVDPSDSETTAPGLAAEDANKSEISLVLEIALKHDKQVSFIVIDESGPPHMRNFVTRCECGEFVTEGDGNSKKSSKKKAAKLMLDKLLEIHVDRSSVSAASSSTAKFKVKNIANKKKNRNLIKEQKANVDYGSGIHPISRLIQIQQANRKKDPVYSLITEQGLPRRREFVMQVECNDLVCQGRGPNKKLAKRNAAEEMLQAMGYSKPSPAPSKSALKSPDHTGNQASNNKHVTFSDNFQTGKVPGVIVRGETQLAKSTDHTAKYNPQVTRLIAQELMDEGKSKTAETILDKDNLPTEPITSHKEQLEFLAKCMGVAVEFTNFPRGTNTKSCLSLVALQTTPPQVFHGNAPTTEESNEKAALQALRLLARGDDDKLKQESSSQSPATNGVRVLKTEVDTSAVETRVDSKMLNGHVSDENGADNSSQYHNREIKKEKI